MDLLIRSFDLLHRDCEKVKLVLVGGGPYAAECKRRASQLSCSDKVIFTGSIPRSKIAPYYSIGDLFVFPSTTDTQGLVLGEALQAGLPCVAVNAGGSPEILADGADSLLTKNDVDDFSVKTRRLLDDPETLHRFSRRAIENSARLSPRVMATGVLSVYQSVLNGD
jgi:glycosyltransferase involved in cell wall biosynthesis